MVALDGSQRVDIWVRGSDAVVNWCDVTVSEPVHLEKAKKEPGVAVEAAEAHKRSNGAIWLKQRAQM